MPTPTIPDDLPARPDAGHPLLQMLIDSIEIINLRACWNYSAMYDVRDALLAADRAARAASCQAAGAVDDEPVAYLTRCRMRGAKFDEFDVVEKGSTVHGNWSKPFPVYERPAPKAPTTLPAAPSDSAQGDGR